MKRPLHTIIAILAISVFANISILNADIWESNSTNGGGEWSNQSTWKSMLNGLPGVPEAGDLIIINGGDLVTISSTVDLSSVHDDKSTSIVIHGILKFWSPNNCGGGACDIDLILDTGSEIDVQVEEGIQAEGPGIGQKDIFIGGVSVLGTNEWPFGPGILPQVPLPIQLVFFKGIAIENIILLKWQTESEENSKDFILERSESGRDGFEKIGRIAASGFSENLESYSFEDKQPLAMSYYRLKTVDYDGSFEYSEIIVVEISHSGVVDFEVFPVPIQDEVNISFTSAKKEKAVLILSNYLGQVIKIEPLELNEGFNKFRFEWSELNSGLNFIIIETSQERFVKKIF